MTPHATRQGDAGKVLRGVVFAHPEHRHDRPFPARPHDTAVPIYVHPVYIIVFRAIRGENTVYILSPSSLTVNGRGVIKRCLHVVCGEATIEQLAARCEALRLPELAALLHSHQREDVEALLGSRGQDLTVQEARNATALMGGVHAHVVQVVAVLLTRHRQGLVVQGLHDA